MIDKNSITTREQMEINSSYSDEIDLFELWRILVKRKWQVLVVTFLVVVLSTAYAFFTKPVYKASGLIEIGRFLFSDEKGAQFKLWDSPSDVAIMAKQLEKGAKVSIPKVGRLQAENIIQVDIEAGSPKAAENRVRKLVERIITKHENTLRQLEEEKSREIEELEKSIIMLERKSDSLGRVVNRIVKREEDSLEKQMLGLVAILKLEIFKDKQNILKLKKNLSSLKKSISPVFLKPTTLINLKSPQTPVKPKKKLIIMLGIVTGLMCGVFVAFFSEFIEKSKGKVATSKGEA